MGKRPKKPCAKIGCYNLVEYPRVYCEAHQEYEDRLKASKYKEYDKQREDDTIWKFYRTREWYKFRQYILSRDNYLCQECLKENKLTKGNTVHHIVHVRDGLEGWNRRLDETNVITICDSCHSKIHRHK